MTSKEINEFAEKMAEAGYYVIGHDLCLPM